MAEIVYEKMIVTEIQVRNNGKRYGSEDIVSDYEDNFSIDFRWLQSEYGRCTGKVYIDKKDGSAKHVGYVFERREQFSDCNETFIAETWVSFTGWEK